MNEPVSKRYGTTIESPYFSIAKPFDYKKQFQLGLQCDSLLTYLAIADVYRSEDSFRSARDKFLDVLKECQGPEDFQKVQKFLETAANIGGYAATFYINNVSLINPQGKEYATKKIQIREHLRKTIEQSVRENMRKQKAKKDEVDEFEDDLEITLMNFERFRENKMVDDEDIDFYIGKFLNLKRNLSYIQNSIDAETFSKYSKEIEMALKYLHNLDHMIQETRKVWEM